MKRFSFFILLVCMILLAATPVVSASNAAVLPVGSASASPSPSPTSSTSPSPTPTPASNSMDAILSQNSKSKGPAVVSMQARLKELGYFISKVTGTYGVATNNAVKVFQMSNNLPSDGSMGPQSAEVLYSNDCKRKPLAAGVTIPSGPAQQAERKYGYGEKLDWSEMDKLIPINTTITVIDFNTNQDFKMIRTGGKNHAEVQSASAEDNQKFLTIFGNAYTWEKRPVLVMIGDKKYAASLFGSPHGQDSTVVSTVMSGSTDLYFPGSLSDISGLPDAEHMSKISRAAGDE